MEDESNFCWTTLYIFIFSFLGSLCSMLLAQLLCLSLVSPFMPMWIIKRKEDEKIRYRVRLAVNNCRKKKRRKSESSFSSLCPASWFCARIEGQTESDRPEILVCCS